MRIGIMARDIGNQVDAPGIIITNLIDAILAQDREDEFVLFFNTDRFVPRYSRHENVKCVVIPWKNRLLWDQLAIPLQVRREKLDLLFHPKHSIPLLASCRTLMHLRGAGYWVNPSYHTPLDLIYQRIMAPLYVRKATHVVVESDYVHRELKKYLAIPEDKMTRIYLAPADHFHKVTDADQLERVRRRYGLPDEFVLTVSRVIENNKKYYPGKNLDNAIKAFVRSTARNHIKFVIIGRQTKRFVAEFPGISDDLKDRLVPLDFVPQEDLPDIYSLAKFFLFPSRQESFGMPITEAMRCGCPVITSTVTACPEIVGDAGIKVDPEDVDLLAAAIDRVNTDADLREDMRRAGLRESGRFSWATAATNTLMIMRVLCEAAALV
jgi:glycosyltransferase involved in cell wall biosynthesis